MAIVLLPVEHPVGLTFFMAHRLPFSGRHYPIGTGRLASLAGICLLTLRAGSLNPGQLARSYSLTDTGLVIGAGCYLRGGGCNGKKAKGGGSKKGTSHMRSK
ncbi:hypothetical protein [Hymenobacter swuensis]|uniref:hypothetical protein n=1 Tax=Hymenobacter swuensis TaxID=1446467 RepID=UPI0004B67EAC|nr:hypothetical protein [Hymenobacter swuensis]